MRALLLAHIVAGCLGILSGFVALYASKGAPLHRRVGMFFVVVMLAMASTGMVLAVLHGAWMVVNLSAATMSGYLVVTALTAVRPVTATTRRIERVAMIVALTAGVMLLTMGVEAIARGGNREGIPFFPFFLFGLVGLFGGIGDFRRMRSAPPRGGVRIARHLWRMCFALFIAAMSFFIGQADVFPKPWRIMPLLALPPFSVLGAMLYWVWRVRVRRSVRGLVGVPVTEDALRGSS